ncbi:MAG: type II secretion system protein [Chromatiaceae bacterium]|nr:type II secretion system protein [Chromatiaceae bacterium]
MARRESRGARGERGFSLLEVLVAFAILAVSLGVLLQIFSRASLTTATAAQYSRAVALAESRLAAVGVEIPLEEGRFGGEADETFVWELSLFPLDSSTIAIETSWVPWQVNASVLWREGAQARRLTLSSLRLGPRSGP